MPRRTGVVWNHALFSFKNDLRQLPNAVLIEADAIMEHMALAAKDACFAAYPIGPGNRIRPGGALKAGLTIVNVKKGVKLKQTAPHAWIFEFGTKRRATRRGWNRGRMPRHPTFKPITISYQKAAVAQIEEMIRAHGAATVTGTDNLAA